jgi:hypothetical protein
MHHFLTPQSTNPTIRKAYLLPYVYVRETIQGADQWTVISSGITSNGGQCEIRLPLTGEGNYRIYMKEPTLELDNGQIFQIPKHALNSGEPSNIEVQPWFSIKATQIEETQNLLAEFNLPNPLGRPTNGITYPESISSASFNQSHTAPSKALDLGEHIITCCLWGDISRTYGKNHPTIVESAHRAALEIIYSEQLTVVPEGRTLNLEDPPRKIQFDDIATSGGSQKSNSFNSNSLMSRDETLRRTHPIAMEFLLDAMQDLGLSFARVTGAWRPHTGSTRHRYAAALDLTHIRKKIETSSGVVDIECWFNRTSSSDQASNPLGTGMSTVTQEKREASKEFHKYLAQQKVSGRLGWLGGPWALRYSDVGLSGNSIFIKTDSIHEHHVHLSVGGDQP